jgi:LPS export ABC transporter protein LptC
MDTLHGDGAHCTGRWYAVNRQALVSLALIIAVAALAGCATKKKRPSAAPAPTIGPVSVRAERSRTTPVSIVVVAHGRILYRILADANDSRRMMNGTYTSHFVNPSVLFLNEDGGRMRATARTADADGAAKVVTLNDAVHVYAADGSILTCDRFSYDEADNRVHGSGHVTVVTKQGDILHGQDVTGDVRLQSLHMSG